MQTRWLIIGTLAGLMSLAGCTLKTDEVLELQRDKFKLQRQLQRAEETIAEQQKTLRQKDKQISTLADLAPEQLEVLFTVEKIVLGRYSGGTNLDQKGGSVLTLEKSGGVFDGIVFGEIVQFKWMPGSNFHQRSQTQQDSFAAEKCTNFT